MSRYFDALNRLRRGREATAPAPDLRLAAAEEPIAEPGLSFPELQLASRQASYAALLDLLRATRKPTRVPAVVIAGVSGREPVHEVVEGIGLQAQLQSIALRRGHLDLSNGARILRISSRRPPLELSSPKSTDGTQSFRLSGGQGPDFLSRGLEKAATGSDLLLIEAPPLTSSVEAALLGEACEGLVLVAEAMVTDRSALEDGIARTRLTGCEILGLVLTGTRRWLPRWIGRLVGLLARS